MNWDRMAGKWKAYKGKAQQYWGKLSDEDIDRIRGRREELEGLLRKRYGYAAESAKSEVDSWLKQSMRLT